MKLSTRRRKIGLVVAVLAVIAAGFFKLQRRRSEESAAAIRQKTAALDLRLKHDARSGGSSSVLPASLAGKQSNKKGKKGQSPQGFLSLLRSDPVLQNRYLAYRRSQVHMKNAPIYAKLHLTAEQIQRFEDNELAVDAAKLDLESAMAAQHLSAHDPAIVALSDKMYADHSVAQKELLGPDGYQALVHFDAEFVPREFVANLAGAATLQSIPLTPQQTEQLSAVVIAESGAPFGKSTNWSNIDLKAQSILTPEQMQLFQQGEVAGPFGVGSRYQDQLNALISADDRADHAKPSTSANPAAGSTPPN